mgnify:CR=1 FL=1
MIWKIDIKEFTDIFRRKVDSLIAVDISGGLKLLNIELKGGLKVSALSIIPLPPEQSAWSEKIPACINDFLRKYNIHHKNAVLCPCLNQIFIKRLQLPDIPSSELFDAVNWKIKEELPVAWAQKAVGYGVIQKVSNNDGSKTADVISVACEEKQITEQVLLLKGVGLSCLSVVPLPFADAKLAAKILITDKQPIAIIHIEEAESYVTFITDKGLEFYRGLPITINKFKESLTGTLVNDRGTVTLSAQDIDEILSIHGIPQSVGAIYKDKIAESEILAMLRQPLELLTQEIKRSFAYYESQFQGGALKNIFLAGAVVKIPNIDIYLSKELKLNVQKINLADKVKASTRISQADLAQCAGAVGLAIDYKSGINLLPREFKAEKAHAIERISLRWVVLTASLFLVFSYVFANVGIQSYQRRLDMANVQLKVLSEVKTIKTNIEQFNNYIIDIGRSQPRYYAIFKKISNAAPKELFLESFSINSDTKQVLISGAVKSSSPNCDIILTKFVRDMEASGYFSDASISTLANSKQEEGYVIRFNVALKLR